MSSLSTAKYTTFVGLDWADAKHDICLQAAGSDQREFDCFAHRPEHIEPATDRKIRERFDILLPEDAMRPGNGRW
jgi:hypothetical protein